ncbi:hypothetical protein V6N13_085988 [Hibiscus sabdariffa]|uniref:Uncharacterized protein n=1 Tax=Hibiscus sabdariffa TaxID=183260 RepID=A0ABR2FS63_9ROSI
MPVSYCREQPSFIGWSTTTRQSLFIDDCLLSMRDRDMNSVRNTWKLIEIATLLTIAPENVLSPSLFKGLHDSALDGSMSLRHLVLSEIVSLMASQITLVSTSEEVHDELNNKLETMMSMLRLIEVFERVGDKIELFHRYLTSRPYITKKESLETIRIVACKTEIETIGCYLARQGKLIKLASLLMVASEKLKITASSESNDLRSNVVRRCIISDLQTSLDAEVRLMGRSNSHKLAEKFKDEKEM